MSKHKPKLTKEQQQALNGFVATHEGLQGVTKNFSVFRSSLPQYADDIFVRTSSIDTTDDGGCFLVYHYYKIDTKGNQMAEFDKTLAGFYVAERTEFYNSLTEMKL